MRDHSIELPRSVRRSPSRTSESWLQKKVSRRKAIEWGTKGLIGGAAALQFRDWWDQANRKLENKGIKGATIEFLPDKKTDFEKFFHNLNYEQKGRAAQLVIEAQLNLINLDNLKAIKKHERDIRVTAGKADIPADLFLGLVFAESGGNEVAVSDAGAKGLTQVMDDLAESWAEKGDFKFTNGEDDDRNNPQKVLEFSARDLREKYERFGDWGLAFWSWHIGESRVYGALRKYFQSNFRRDLGDINVYYQQETQSAKEEAFAKVQEVKKSYKGMIEATGVSVHHLLEDSDVKAMFEGPEWNDTHLYPYRIIAGMLLYQGNRDLV